MMKIGWRRSIKTLFFLTNMIISLFLFSAPVLLVVADSILPCALLSAITPRSPPSLSNHLKNYDFRSSLIDIPLVSIVRSLVIFMVYSLCDGPALSHGPYLGTTTMCSLISVVYVSIKAFVFGGSFESGEVARQIVVYNYHDHRLVMRVGSGHSWGTAAMFFSFSMVLALGHIVVAYRTSCKERRKLLFHRTDLEAVFAAKTGFPIYHKK